MKYIVYSKFIRECYIIDELPMGEIGKYKKNQNYLKRKQLKKTENGKTIK